MGLAQEARAQTFLEMAHHSRLLALALGVYSCNGNRS